MVHGGLSGANIESAHSHNRRVVLETVRLHGPLSRAEISNLTDLSSQTISNIADKLVDNGTLQAMGLRRGRRGQPAIELDINPRGGYAVGLHLDRDHLTGVLLDLGGNVLQISHDEWVSPQPDAALPRLVDVVRTLVRKQRIEIGDLWGVGIGLPGPLDTATGSPASPPNFPGWSDVPLGKLLSRALSVPVFLETDATAAAVGERWFGAGKDINDFFYVYIGMGVGGGIILGGKPYRGGFNNAAMFGHVPVEPNGNACGCGGTGCLETYISLASLYAHLAAQGRSARSLAKVDALLSSGDLAMNEWIDQASRRLARALVTVENLLNPHAFIFGGRVSSALLDRLLAETEMRLAVLRMRGRLHHPRLLRARAMDDAAALGAATLPLFDIFTPGQLTLRENNSLSPLVAS
jgi:predicted NBD/HSP70 family sugar kinase